MRTWQTRSGQDVKVSFFRTLNRCLLSPPFCSMAVKHGPYLLTKRKRVQAFEIKYTCRLLRLSYFEHKTDDWVRSTINFLVGPQEPIKEAETCMVRACHILPHPPSWHPGGWETPWSAEEMLDGQHQRMGIPAHGRTSHKGPLQERPEENLC